MRRSASHCATALALILSCACGPAEYELAPLALPGYLRDLWTLWLATTAILAVVTVVAIMALARVRRLARRVQDLETLQAREEMLRRARPEKP